MNDATSEAPPTSVDYTSAEEKETRALCLRLAPVLIRAMTSKVDDGWELSVAEVSSLGNAYRLIADPKHRRLAHVIAGIPNKLSLSTFNAWLDTFYVLERQCPADSATPQDQISQYIHNIMYEDQSCT